jgi:glycosyltransferase involved in cell wall biosynthesis
MNVCTVCHRRELARARVLVATLLEHHPDAHVTVLMLDVAPQLPQIDGAQVLGMEEVIGPRAGLIAAANDAEELRAAALPFLLRRVSPAIYLAPGQRVLGSLDELAARLAQSSLVLASRLSGGGGAGHGDAFTTDGGGGAFSHHLLGAAEGAQEVLERWPLFFPVEADKNPVSEWFESIPAITDDLAVLREKGWGLDPWTMSARVNGDAPAEMSLFDFSELDPLQPALIWKTVDGLRLSSVPQFADVCDRHVAELLAAGYAEDDARPDPLAELPDGVRLRPAMRRLLVEGIEDGSLTSSPYTESGRRELYAYFNEPADRGRAVGLTKLHMEIWNGRDDLKVAYPHIDGPDGEGYAGWLHAHGVIEEGLGEPLLPPAPLTHIGHDADPYKHEREPLWGVNVAGFFTSELGLGEAARLLIAGLDARGIPALPVQAQLVPPCRQGAEFTYADPDEAAFPTNIVCMNGDTIPREAGSAFFDGRHTIAVWWWEVGEFPSDWEGAFEYVDEVWVASDHIHDAIAPASPVPVVKVPMPVLEPRPAPLGREQLGLPQDGFLFLYVYDYHSTSARKNPLGTIEAFKRAFPEGDGRARLVLKSINADRLPHHHDQVLRAIGERSDITAIDAYVSAGEKNAMLAACDAYVSLHRSEGFGLTVAEAMLLGKPVIVTRYGGTLEFTEDGNAFLVDWSPIRVGEDASPYPPDAMWADPDVEQAAQLMRNVFEDPHESGRRARQGRADVLERHSAKVAGAAMEARLRLIHDRRVKAGERALNVAQLPHLDLGYVHAKIESGPPLGGERRPRWLLRSLRRLTGGMMRPWVESGRSVDRELERSLATLDERLHNVAGTLQAGQQAHFAEVLASNRRLRGELAAARARLDALERRDDGVGGSREAGGLEGGEAGGEDVGGAEAGGGA